MMLPASTVDENTFMIIIRSISIKKCLIINKKNCIDLIAAK